MKEITRIHIAKVPYDAEVEAKKALESYIKKLEAYSSDTEIINDIEIRITEILAERGVAKNSVVTVADIEALKDQLGEPKEFMGDGDMAMSEENIEQTTTFSRKLYRDTDHAILGGVMSGIGAFFGVNPVWVRLLFIVLALASFGTALIVYIVLWAVIPPAKTATDKLQMKGRPVTIASIRELNEQPAVTQSVAIGRQVLIVIAGILASFGALGSVILVAGATARVLVAPDVHSIWHSGEAQVFVSAFVLFAISGLLLATLCVLGATAAFTQKISKRLVVSAVVVTILGIASFGTGVGLAQYGVTLRQQAVEANTHEVSLKLPANSRTASSLQVDAPGFNVKYIADTGEPNARMRVVTASNGEVPKVTVSLEGTALKITGDGTKLSDVCYWPGCGQLQQQIIIYGPMVQSIEAAPNSYVAYSASKQSSLALTAKKNATITIDEGIVDHLEGVTDEEASISASDATVRTAKVTFGSDSTVNLGTVQTLDVANGNSCPAGKFSRLDVWDAESLTVNGSAKPVQSGRLTCLTLSVEGGRND